MRNSAVSEEAEELYIYSDVDPLCPVSAVEGLLEFRRAEGRRVSAKRFEGTGHVMHFRERPEEYERAVREFLAGGARGADTGRGSKL